MEILNIKDLSFSYSKKSLPILKNINYCFESGKIYSIVGHNGAGKTTLIRICLNILLFEDGELLWKESLVKSYVPDLGGLYEYLTVEENLKIVFKLCQMESQTIDIHINEALKKGN
ncbi:MAG: ATP-binding cassette domain-containing protein [Breznakia sp.]